MERQKSLTEMVLHALPKNITHTYTRACIKVEGSTITFCITASFDTLHEVSYYESSSSYIHSIRLNNYYLRFGCSSLPPPSPYSWHFQTCSLSLCFWFLSILVFWCCCFYRCTTVARFSSSSSSSISFSYFHHLLAILLFRLTPLNWKSFHQFSRSYSSFLSRFNYWWGNFRDSSIRCVCLHTVVYMRERVNVFGIGSDDDRRKVEKCDTINKQQLLCLHASSSLRRRRRRRRWRRLWWNMRVMQTEKKKTDVRFYWQPTLLTFAPFNPLIPLVLFHSLIFWTNLPPQRTMFKLLLKWITAVNNRFNVYKIVWRGKQSPYYTLYHIRYDAYKLHSLTLFLIVCHIVHYAFNWTWSWF